MMPASFYKSDHILQYNKSNKFVTFNNDVPQWSAKCNCSGLSCLWLWQFKDETKVCYLTQPYADIHLCLNQFLS